MPSVKRTSSRRPIVAVDFDDVLINNSGVIKKELFGLIAEEGVLPAKILAVYRRLRTRRFSPQMLTRSLWKDAQKRGSVAAKIARLFRKPRRYNYPGASRFLDALSKKYRLTMVSYGDEKFQRIKIAQSGLARYFERILITRNPDKKDALKKLASGGHGIILADDSTKAVRTARSLGLRAIKVKKGLKNSAYYAALVKRIEKAAASLRKAALNRRGD